RSGELSSDPCAIALCASRPLSPGAAQHSLQASVTPYSDRSSTRWIASACLAHSFDHLVGADEQRLRGGDAGPSCAVVEPGEETRPLGPSSKYHLRGRHFVEPSHRV